ncbi:MAG: DUF6531 domain-containing protein [Candidatus Thiodiazotropha sp.]
MFASESVLATEWLPPVQTYECEDASNYRTGKWLSWAEAFDKVLVDQPYDWHFTITSVYYDTSTRDYDGRVFHYCMLPGYSHIDGDHSHMLMYAINVDSCFYNLGNEFITIGQPHTVDGERKCLADKACACNENLEGSDCVEMEKSTWVKHEPNITLVYEYRVNNQGQLCPPKEVPEKDCKESNTPLSNPIDCATGQKIQTETDYQGVGTDPLHYSRVYQSPLSDDPNSNPTSGMPWLNVSQPGFSIETFEDGAQLGLFTLGHKVMRTLFSPSGGGGWSSNPYMDPIGMVAGTGGGRSISYKSKVYQLNAAGQTVAKEESGIQRYTYSYNAAGLVSEIRNRFGAFLQFTYNADDRLILLTDQAGSEIHYTYDALGNLHEVIYPDATPGNLSDNPRRIYQYENSGLPYHLTGIIDESGLQVASFDYDASGRGVLSEHADGAERVVFSYPREGQAIVRFYRNNDADIYREEAYTYGKFRGAYQLTSRTIQICNDCALGNETWVYDYQGSLIKHTNMGGKVTVYGYDRDGRKLTQTVGHGSPGSQRTSYTWDTDLEKILTETTSSTVTTYNYDANGLLLSKSVTPVQ